MNERLTYEIYVKDLASGGFKKLSAVGGSTYRKLAAGQTNFTSKVATGQTAVAGLGASIKRMVAGYIGLGAGIYAVSNTMRKWDTQAQAEAQIMQGVASTNMAAGRSFDDLTKAASELQKKTLFGDESILQGVTAQMLTFTNVTGTAFDRAQQAALDVTSRLYGSKASAESLRSTSIMLGKALNDPVSNMGALSRSGIQFSEGQKTLIKNLWKAGETAQAQSIILDELNKQYGGSAEAAAKVGLGPWKQFMNMIGDIQEKIGPFFNIILTGLISIYDWIERNATILKILTIAATGAAIAYGVYYLWTNRITMITKIWTAVQWALNAAMTANPIGLIIAAIGAMIAAVIYAWYKFDGFRGVLFGLWDAFKSVFTGIRDLVKSVMGGIGELILGALTFDIDRIQGGLRKLGEGFSSYGKGIVDAYKTGAEAGEKFQPKLPGFLSGFAGEDQSATAGAGGMPGTGVFGTGEDGAGGAVGEGVTSITGGGKKQTNINISIEKLIETFRVTPESGETWEDVEDKILDTLMRVINSANRITA